MGRYAVWLPLVVFILAACAAQLEPILIETPVVSATVYVTAEPTARPTRTPAPKATSSPRATTASRSVSITAPININTATAEELDKLSHIGPALAKRIIEYRLKNGPFKRIEDIKDVSGIGDVIFEEIKGMISVGQ